MIKLRKRATFLAGIFLMMATLPAHALERFFPPIAKRGVLSMEEYPDITLDGKPRRLSAGAWIKNRNNTIDMPVTLRGHQYTVNYTETQEGDLDRVWILTEEEAKKPAPAKGGIPVPVKNFDFASSRDAKEDKSLEKGKEKDKDEKVQLIR